MNQPRTTERSESIDAIQSDEYAFPYHYIPSAGDEPMLRKSWGFADSYLAAIQLVKGWLTTQVAEDRSAGHRHMDYGCGDGGFVFALNQMKQFSTLRFEGIDIDPHAIRWAELFSASRQNVTFHCGDLINLDEERYDSGTLIEVLEHIPPDAVPAFVAGIARSLKAGGTLFVTVPSIEKPVSQKHYRHFDFGTLQDCFRPHFDVVDCFGFEKRGRLSRWFKRTFMRKKRYVETVLTTRYIVNELQQRHVTIDKCGRIGLILRKPSRV